MQTIFTFPRKTNLLPIACMLIFLSGSLFSCSKNDDIPPAVVDTLPNTPIDTLPRDTTSLVRTLEVIYQTTQFTDTTKIYSFYYDALKRVTLIGIRNYGVLFDSATLRFFYTGSQVKPSMVISPNSVFSSWGSGTTVFDTTYFYYGNSGILSKDSTNQIAYQSGNGSTFRQKLVRQYQYPSPTLLTVEMSRNAEPGGTLNIFRKDTVRYAADSSFQTIRVTYPHPIGTRQARLEGFGYSNFLNPLAKLNISGLHYSWLYMPNDVEILGNTNYKTLSNTNILPTYIDFASPRIPTIFFNSAYNSLGDFLNGDEFDLVITPWNLRNNYPASYSVKGSSSYPGDTYIYRFSY